MAEGFADLMDEDAPTWQLSAVFRDLIAALFAIADRFVPHFLY